MKIERTVGDFWNAHRSMLDAVEALSREIEQRYTLPRRLVVTTIAAVPEAVL